jgi:hypothetical protein
VHGVGLVVVLFVAFAYGARVNAALAQFFGASFAAGSGRLCVFVEK